MNKQELIDEIKLSKCSLYYDDMWWIPKDRAINLANVLDEPKKVVIPWFVAKWIEKRKSMGKTLHSTIISMSDNELVGDWYYDENYNHSEEKTILIARAWIDGYEVEQEKLYTVEIPNPNSGNPCYLHRSGKNIGIVITQFKGWKKQSYNQLTEAEIKKDFEWAWNAGFAKEVVDDTEV